MLLRFGETGGELRFEPFEKFLILFENGFDFEPGDFEWRDGGGKVSWKIDAVFFGSYQDLGAGSLSLRGNAAQLGGLVFVVIGKRPAIHDFEADVAENVPKRLGIAEGAERGNSREGQFGHRGVLPAHPPLERMREKAKDGSVRVELANLLGEQFETQLVVGPGDDNRVGARKRMQRLAQPAERNHMAVSERREAIDDHDVRIAVDLAMLEPVVEQEEIDFIVLHEKAACFNPVCADADWRYARAQENLRFIAGDSGRDLGSGRENDVSSGRAATVAASENSGAVAPVIKLLSEIIGEGRFARATHGDAAHAYNGNGKALLACFVLPLLDSAPQCPEF